MANDRNIDSSWLALRIHERLENGSVSVATAYETFSRRKSTHLWKTLKDAPRGSKLWTVLLSILNQRAESEVTK